jgi:DNA-binding protein HU-beta
VDKKEFIEQLAKRTGMTIREARTALNACLDLIVSTNSRREKVTFTGFGTFEVQHKKTASRRSKPTKDEVERRRKRFKPIFLPELPFFESLS